jgi:hypothetical protein
MERARWNTELSYKKLYFKSVQLFGVKPYFGLTHCVCYQLIPRLISKLPAV